MTCPGLGTLPETRHVIRETLRAGPVVDDSRTAFALRKSPVDNELAERASLRLHVSVTIAGDITPSATVEDLSSSARAPNLCRFPVKPSGGFHFVLLLESGGEKVILREVERLKPDGSRQNANLCWLQKLIYIINTGILCQAILRKSQ